MLAPSGSSPIGAQKPHEGVAKVLADMRAEYLAEVAIRAASFAQKAATAARRGNRTATAVRLRQLHLCTAEAIRSFRADLGLKPEDTR